MRRLLILVLATVTILGVWAEGKQEAAAGKPEPLVVLRSTADEVPFAYYTFTIAEIANGIFHKKFPTVNVEYLVADLSTGADKTMRAMVAAGTPPDVYFDSWVRAASYLRSDFALDLSKYTDLGDYLPGALEGTTREGTVLGVPCPGDAQAMAVNLEIIRDVGFAPKDWMTWTTDEYLQLAELVKVKYGGKKWVTGLFAGNQSGDYLIRNWGATFGAQFFAEGDHSKTAINTPAGKALLDWFLLLHDKGYVRPDWITQVDDDYVLDWARGKLATAPFFFGWIKPYFDQVISEGGKPFDYMFVPFPRAPGVEKVGAFYTGAGLVGSKKADEERNKMTAVFIDAYNSPEIQLVAWAQGGPRPNRKSVTDLILKPEQYSQIGAVTAANGYYDLGGTIPLYAATRPLFPQALQKLVKTHDSKTVLAEYAAAIDKLLSQ